MDCKRCGEPLINTDAAEHLGISFLCHSCASVTTPGLATSEKKRKPGAARRQSGKPPAEEHADLLHTNAGVGW